MNMEFGDFESFIGVLNICKFSPWTFCVDMWVTSTIDGWIQIIFSQKSFGTTVQYLSCNCTFQWRVNWSRSCGRQQEVLEVYKPLFRKYKVNIHFQKIGHEYSTCCSGSEIGGNTSKENTDDDWCSSISNKLLASGGLWGTSVYHVNAFEQNS